MTVSRSGVDAGSLDHLRPFQPKAPPAADRKVTPAGGRGDAKAIAEFVAPSRETAHWLGNPAIAGVLSSVSQELAPDGVAQSSRDQYVASVVETHLSARRQLARHLNALLRA
jgi:hypothetical protein